MQRALPRLVGLLALGVLGCGSGHTVGGSDAGAGGPTYYGDIEPILRESCVDCHRTGGAAPFALDTYADARDLAEAVATVTRERRMPPWPAVTEGDCPPQVGARRISDAEIARLGAWAAAGAPRGTRPAREPAMPPVWGSLDRVDAVLQADAPYLPLLGTDDYRCFAVDPHLDGDRFLTAYAVHEDAPGIIHHVQLWAIDSADAEAALDRLDAAADGPGYPCPDSIGVDGRYVSVWAPSDPIRRHPPGTGMRLSGGHRVVVQFHYHDHGQGLADRTAIELELATHVDHEATMWTLSPSDFTLPPGQAKVPVGASTTVGDTGPYRLWGVRGHMHTHGTSVLVNQKTGAGSSCLLSIPRWDPAWQLMYFYEAPIELQGGTELDLSCTYSTTGETSPIRDGLTTSDEMCFAFFYVTQG